MSARTIRKGRRQVFVQGPQPGPFGKTIKYATGSPLRPDPEHVAIVKMVVPGVHNIPLLEKLQVT